MRYRNKTITPPKNDSYAEWLRYAVQSSDPDAGELPFLVSMWNCSLVNKGLTVEQQEAIAPYLTEVFEFYNSLYTNVNDPATWDKKNLVFLTDKRKGK